MASPPPPKATEKPSGYARRIISAIVALTLLVSALWVVFSHHSALDSAFEHASHASPVLIALALLLPACNYVLITLSFWLLNNAYARVALREMGALIAGAWLLNYLPLRPGMIARLAYHKKQHAITIRQSMWVYAISMALSALAIATSLAIALLLGAHQTLAWIVPALLLPAILAIFLAWMARASDQPGLARLLCVFALRHADMLVWVARYSVIFAIIGSPLSLIEAVAIAIVSQLVMLVPIAGNGLGLREWAIGLTAGLLPAFAGDAATATGLAGDLVHRGFETIVALSLGIPALLWLQHRLSRTTDNSSKSDPAEPR